MVDAEVHERITAVRRFNRFYTPLAGLLDDGYLDSPFSLTQVRVLYEIAHGQGLTATDLARRLALDPAYLSRILHRFAADGLIERRRGQHDGRIRLLSLTEHGRAVFDPLDERSQVGVGRLLERLSRTGQRRLVDAMTTIEEILTESPRQPPRFVLRPPRPGEFGWIVERHGALYAQEYGWDETFEALVAEIVAAYIRAVEPGREHCWIAEMEGEAVGSVLCVRKSKEVAQLRLLLVEPGARGHGIGRGLVDECIRFARSAGYERLVLWTNDVLVAARRIYGAAGFRLVTQEPHHSFGHDLVGQNWELDLRARPDGRRG